MFNNQHIPFDTYVELDGYLWRIGMKLNNLVLLSHDITNISYNKDGKPYCSGSSGMDRWVDYRDPIFDQFKTKTV